MKLLKIENKQGFFFVEGGTYQPMDKLTKEYLLALVDLTLSDEDVEFDEYDAELIGNQAHQIVYENVYEQLNDLYGRRQEFIDQTETVYLSEYERYQEDIEAVD